MMRIVPLGEIVQPAQVERAGDLKLTVLSMTRSSGLVPQESVFNKVVASRDISKYNIIIICLACNKSAAYAGYLFLNRNTCCHESHAACTC